MSDRVRDVASCGRDDVAEAVAIAGLRDALTAARSALTYVQMPTPPSAETLLSRMRRRANQPAWS